MQRQGFSGDADADLPTTIDFDTSGVYWLTWDPEKDRATHINMYIDDHQVAQMFVSLLAICVL